MSSLFEIEYECYYFLLLPVFFLVCERYCRYRPGKLYFPHITAINRVNELKNRLTSILKWLTIIFLSLAMASPVLVNKEVLKNRIGYDIVTAFDASGSMKYPFAGEAGSSKYEVTKTVIREFIKKRSEDNLAAVAFGKYAFIIAPLTYDKAALESMVEQVHIHNAFSQGTAIGDGIAQSVRVLKESEAKNKIIILATDGEEEGDVVIPYDQATALAREHGIKIYAIGIGQNGHFNASSLKYIAKETGGAYFSANDSEALSKVYDRIDTLEKSKITTSDFVKKEYLFAYPLFVAILSLLLYLYFKYREKR
jgi:Ca-activated chloride channel family protein